MSIPPIIVTGRALVRLIEAIDILLGEQLADTPLAPNEIGMLAQARTLAKQRLREVVAEQRPEVVAEILAVSENQDFPPVGASWN